MRAHESTTPPCSGTAPPERFVPEARGVTGKRCSSARRSTPGDLVAITRQHDCLGPRALQRRGVRRVGDEVVLARQYVLRPDQVAQARRGGAALARGYHRALMAGGWRIEALRALRARRGAARAPAAASRATCSSPGCTARSPRRCSSRAASSIASRPPRRPARSCSARTRTASPTATRQNARGVDLNRNFPATSWREGTTPSYPAGIDPGRARARQPHERLVDRRRAALGAGERGARGADRAPRARRSCSICTRRWSSC